MRDNLIYIEKWSHNEPCFELETLSISEKANDFILTTLRTTWGMNMSELSQIIGKDFYTNYIDSIEKFKSMDMIEQVGDTLVLTKKGKFYADGIASELFIDTF